MAGGIRAQGRDTTGVDVGRSVEDEPQDCRQRFNEGRFNGRGNLRIMGGSA